MPYHPRTSREAFPLAEAQQLRATGHSLRSITAAIGWSTAHTQRQLTARAPDPTRNGHPPVHSSAPERSALPVHSSALVQRLASAPERTEPPVWVGGGTDIAQDMRDRIAAYAAQHRLHKREALDTLLRLAFAVVDQEVGHA
jgi:hypothetical protein